MLTRMLAAFVALVVFVTFGVSSIMAQQTIKNMVTSFPGFDVPFEVSGEVYFLSNVGCWALVSSGDDFAPMELGNLPEEFRKDGLRVAAKVHLEEGERSECVPPFKLIINEISRRD